MTYEIFIVHAWHTAPFWSERPHHTSAVLHLIVLSANIYKLRSCRKFYRSEFHYTEECSILYGSPTETVFLLSSVFYELNSCVCLCLCVYDFHRVFCLIYHRNTFIQKYLLNSIICHLNRFTATYANDDARLQFSWSASVHSKHMKNIIIYCYRNNYVCCMLIIQCDRQCFGRRAIAKMHLYSCSSTCMHAWLWLFNIVKTNTVPHIETRVGCLIRICYHKWRNGLLIDKALNCINS